jgi:hypothetical protein
MGRDLEGRGIGKKIDADWVGAKEEGWAGEYEAVQDPSRCVV